MLRAAFVVQCCLVAIGLRRPCSAWEETDLSDLLDLPCTVERRDGRALSMAEFRSYDGGGGGGGGGGGDGDAQQRRPVILTGLADAWPATRGGLWEPAALLDASSTLGATAVLAGRPLQQHLARATHPQPDARRDHPPYSWDHTFFDRNPAWQGHFRVERFFTEDMYNHSKAHAMPWRWLILGPAQSGTRWHRDPYNISAWNAVTAGRKLWLFYPESRTRVPGLCDGLEPDETCGWTPLRWLRERLPALPPADKPTHACVQQAGEIMYIPGGFWHMVLNLDSPTVAVTQNVCHGGNLRRVLDGMKAHAAGLPVLRAQAAELVREWAPRRPELFDDADLAWAAAADAAAAAEAAREEAAAATAAEDEENEDEEAAAEEEEAEEEHASAAGREL